MVKSCCYLCGSTSILEREGRVRDRTELQILECKDCSLVFLSEDSHVVSGFYEESSMHRDTGIGVEEWLNNSAIDDTKRFNKYKPILANRKVLDFGCGAGGFLRQCNDITACSKGIELDRAVHDYWGDRLSIYPNVKELPKDIKFDVITSFHVFEHLKDPVSVLRELGPFLTDSGLIIIEVPSANDALLSLYDCDPFKNFTYWSQHLYLFNSHSLTRMIEASGFRTIRIEHIQRYPLSNHLHWLSQGKPGGHQYWGFLDDVRLNAAYESALAKLGITDTIVAQISK